MSKRVCVLIVTYNRKNYLKTLLQSLCIQTHLISKILVFDNASTDGTAEMLLSEQFISSADVGVMNHGQLGEIQVLYYLNHENSGGSGGFHKGFELALAQDCDYIWTMDDDVLPEKDCLEKLLSVINKDVRLVIPSRTDDHLQDYAVTHLNMSNPFLYNIVSRKTMVYNKDIQGDSIRIKDMPFEGPLIDISLIKEIGLPRGDLFIIFDDTEYAHRASRATELRYVKNAVLHRQIVPAKTKNRLMGWKEYYAFRNQYWFDRTYGENIFVRQLRPILNHLDMCMRAILKRKWSNLRVLKRAYYDGTHGILGKTVEPGEKI